eukprot:gene18131-20647_t
MFGILIQVAFVTLLLAFSCQGAVTVQQQFRSNDPSSDSLKHNPEQNYLRQNTKFKLIEFAKLSNHPEITKKNRVQSDVLHRVVIVRKQSNLEKLEEILLDVSDPASANYGHHLSKDNIAALTANPEAVDSITDFLVANNINDWNASRYDDYISAVGPVHVWERLFDTQFYEFEHALLPGKRFIRCLKYSLPEYLSDHMEGVLNTVQFPDHHVGKRLHIESHKVSNKDTESTGTVTPALLNQVYNIASNTGNPLTNQAVFATTDQTFSPSDLSIFQGAYNLPQESIAANVGGHVADDACVNDINDCMEANLDVQYIMAVAQNVPTTYYYYGTGGDVWLSWIESVADLANPPDVFTISYGSYEAAFSETYLQAFNVEAMKLGVAGTTLLAASGDDGVAGFYVRSGRLSCDYYAMFPASSPYVTAVGGTMGPESGNTEVACQSSKGSQITTGGGFSNVYALPSWQATEVTNYIRSVVNSNSAPLAGYDPTRRGYPDISVLANNYVVAADGLPYIVSGTPASSPVVAGMVSLVNSARRAAGNSTLGWLNPALYAYAPLFVNDITSGDNKCLTANVPCCPQGFTASTGWDPVTGLGSLDFGKFLHTFTHFVAPVETPPIISEASQWMVMQGYEQAGCSGNQNDVLALSGFPTNQCLVQYDNYSNPVASVRYSCGGHPGSANTWYYRDLECGASSFMGFEQHSLGCTNLATATTSVRSIRYYCSESLSTELPLPTYGNHVVQRAFNDPSQCRLNATAYFHSWRTGHCFATDDSTSFMMTDDGHELSYSDVICSQSALVENTTLSNTCDVVIITDEQDPGFVTTGVTSTYTVYLGDVANDRQASSPYVYIAGGVLFLLMSSCSCARRE